MTCAFCDEKHPGGVPEEALASGHPFYIDRGRGVQAARRRGSPAPWTNGLTFPEWPPDWVELPGHGSPYGVSGCSVDPATVVSIRQCQADERACVLIQGVGWAFHSPWTLAEINRLLGREEG